jgi:small-conductance mechanosensitive channel
VFELREPGDLEALLSSLARSSALIELGVLAACLLLAYGVVRAWSARTRVHGRSVWFGEKVYDGVLFPTLALGVAIGAAFALRRFVPLAVFQLAVPILLSLVIIRIGVRVLHVAFPKSPVVRAFERTLSWLVWIGLVLWMTGVLPLVASEADQIKWKIGGADVSLRRLFEGIASGLVVMVAVLWVSAAIEQRLLAHASDSALSLRKIAANATRVGLLVVGVLFALSAAGIPIAALSVFGGAIGVGIGFGLQKLAANYVSGFVILAERALRIGDMVKVDNFEGRITDISTRFTTVRSLGGRESLIPNEMLITQRVESFTLADPKISVSTVVQVAYGTDLDALFPRLVAVVADVPRVLDDPAPGVTLSNFAADGLELTIGFWIGDSYNGTGNVKSDVNLAVLRTLNELGIDIPFPQRTMHVIQVPASPNGFPSGAAGEARGEAPTEAPSPASGRGQG